MTSSEHFRKLIYAVLDAIPSDQQYVTIPQDIGVDVLVNNTCPQWSDRQVHQWMDMVKHNWGDICTTETNAKVRIPDKTTGKGKYEYIDLEEFVLRLTRLVVHNAHPEHTLPYIDYYPDVNDIGPELLQIVLKKSPRVTFEELRDDQIMMNSLDFMKNYINIMNKAKTTKTLVFHTYDELSILAVQKIQTAMAQHTLAPIRQWKHGFDVFQAWAQAGYILHPTLTTIMDIAGDKDAFCELYNNWYMTQLNKKSSRSKEITYPLETQP